MRQIPRNRREPLVIFEMLRTIFAIAKKRGAKTIQDIKINNFVNGYIFTDEEKKPYSKEENKMIRKKLIHLYVAIFHYYNIFASDNVEDIAKEIDEILDDRFI